MSDLPHHKWKTVMVFHLSFLFLPHITHFLIHTADKVSLSDCFIAYIGKIYYFCNQV